MMRAITFAENGVIQAVMQANKPDLLLLMNGKPPLLIALSDNELKRAVQEITKLLQAQQGSLSQITPQGEAQ